MPAAKAQSRTTNEFERSNSTTNTFIGGTPKAWMTGQSPKSLKVSAPKVTSQASKVPHRAGLDPGNQKAVDNRDSTNTAFGPNFESSRYLTQRQRHEGVNGSGSRSSNSLAVDTTPLALSPQVVEHATYTLPAFQVDASRNAENVLPSPSPSVEARQTCTNAVEAQDKEHQAQVAETEPAEAPNATFEEVVIGYGGIDQHEILLKVPGKGHHGPTQIAAAAVTQDYSGTNPSTDLGLRGQPPGPRTQRRSESDSDALAPLTASKRPQEITDEPRKRLQSLPGSSSNDVFALPSATALPLSQNAENVQSARSAQSAQNLQNHAAAARPGMEMLAFAQQLERRMQQVANLPERKGSHVERPRLGLLREACQNSDLFYLILHQMFCFEHHARKSDREIPNLDEVHRRGLSVVAFLLVSNDEMVDDAVAWFSVFPMPWGNSLFKKAELGSAQAKVQRCLASMSAFWTDMRSRCSKRRYPPLVDELAVLFNVDSFLFQQIIFRAILRDIWSGQFDDCFLFAENLFSKDFKAVMSRSSLGSTPPDLVEAYQRAVIKEYQQVIESHWQHTSGGTTANVAAPIQQQTQTRSSIGSHNPKELQPGRNKTNRSPLTLDLHAAQHLNRPASSGPASIASQASVTHGQGNPLNQSQALASSTFPSPQVSNFTQSPAALQSFFSPGFPTQSPVQWNSPQQQVQRRASSTAGSFRNASESMIAPRRTSHVVPSNAPGNPRTHQVQLNLGHQQHTHEQVPSSSVPNPLSRPQSDIRRSLSNRTGRTSLGTTGSHSSIQSTPSLSVNEDIAPFIRSYPPLPAHPNPSTSALHQAHLRSPTLTFFDPSQKSVGKAKCFRFISNVFMPPEELDCKNSHVKWDFNVNKELTERFARDTPGSQGAPPFRTITPGSRLCRIRCINLKDNFRMPTQSEWAVADNVWPFGTAVALNGIALDFRKKTHHGKDLPIDVTRNIRAGQNDLTTAIIGIPENNTSRYAIGVETIQIVDEQKIRSEIQTLPSLKARKRILDQSKDLDPDIEVIQSQRVLDLTDPFTARIFQVPVRGINCQHNQCFDRDTFLETRNVKVPGEPCGPDEFRCPICRQDARPQSLMIDEFFVGIRAALIERDRLDAKAIILHDSGEWDIKEEDEATGESGDGTGRRTAKPAATGIANASAGIPSVPFREVIELDDD